MFANHGYTHFVKSILQKNPTIINTVCSNKQSVLEYSLTPCLSIVTNEKTELFRKSEDNIVELTNALFTCGEKIDFTVRNYLGARPIEYAVRYATIKIIDLLINYSFDVNENRIKNRVFPIINNNDLISYAVQVSRMDMMKHLINIGYPLHMYHINKNSKLQVSTALITSIKFKRDNCALYLLDLPEISKSLKNHTVTEYLFDLATEVGITNQTIISKIYPQKHQSNLKNPDKTYKKICQRNKLSVFEQYEKKIERYILNYHSKRYTVLNGLSILLSIIQKIDKYTGTEYEICRIIRRMKTYNDFIGPDHILLTNLTEIIADFIDYSESVDIMYCIQTVNNNEIMKSSDFIVGWYLSSLKKMNLFEKRNRIYKSKKYY